MAEKTLARVALTVPDISCDHCVRTVTGALRPLAGVADVAVDLPTKTVAVSYDPDRVSLEQMREALADEDYPVVEARSVA